MTRTLKSILVAAGALLAAQAASPAQVDAANAGPDLDSVRGTLQKWFETEQVISKEKNDWQVGKDLLEQRISLLEGEIAGVEEKIAQSRLGVAEADRKRAELLRESEQLEAASAALERVIAELERKSNQLVKRLPDPIRERIAPLSNRIPAGPSVTKATLGERFQNVVGVLNEVNKFDRDITVTSELRTLPGGAVMEVAALYVGLGQAYYVTPKGDAAGVGRPGDEGWTWTPANELAGQISEAIEILKNEKQPAYVPLPVTIQ